MPMSIVDPNRFAAPGNTTAEGEAYIYILSQIRRGEYKPGDRLSAETIASQLDMSRMPVREAFRRLAAEELLTIRPNRGVTVAVLTQPDVDEIFEMRSVLEGLAVRLAVPHVDENAALHLMRLLEEMEQAVSRRDVEQWLSLHREFHQNLCGLSRRPRLVHAIYNLHTALEPYLRLWFLNTNEPIGVRAEHEAVIDAARTGDPKKAESMMKEHIVTTAPDLAPYLHTKPGGRRTRK